MVIYATMNMTVNLSELLNIPMNYKENMNTDLRLDMK